MVGRQQGACTQFLTYTGPSVALPAIVGCQHSAYMLYRPLPCIQYVHNPHKLVILAHPVSKSELRSSQCCFLQFLHSFPKKETAKNKMLMPTEYLEQDDSPS